MSIVFFGTTDTGWHGLEHMVRAGLPVRGIVTGLPEFEISYARGKVQNLRHRSFQNFQNNFGIPILTFTRQFDETVLQTLADWRPELFVVMGWYHLIPARVRALAPLGAVGIHWSLLPKYRGGSPLVWAIINGETETGASLFYMEDRIDAGKIVAQASVPIAAHEIVGDLIEKLNAISRKLVSEHVPRILNGTAAAWEQDESAATFFPPRAPEDGRIDWQWPARRVYDFIRAQTLPYPCAFTHHVGHKIKIVRATLQPQPGLHVRVRAGDGAWLGLESVKVEENSNVLQALQYFQRGEVQFEK